MSPELEVLTIQSEFVRVSKSNCADIPGFVEEGENGHGCCQEQQLH